MSEKVLRTHPELWEACKQEAVEKIGKFSARAMQHAVILYKQRGGEYLNERRADNALTQWSKDNDSKI